MKVWAIIKGIISYIVAMLFATIFALFLNANVGWFILLALILAPVVSVLFAWLSSRLVTVSCEMEETLLSKGDKCSMTIRVRNASIFPAPPIEISLTNAPGLRREGEDILVSVLPRMTRSFGVNFQAKICGLSATGIERVRVTDYLGLFAFTLKNVNPEEIRRKIAVIPEVAEISAKDDQLLKTMQMSLHNDDSEDTVAAVVNSFGGFPGYDSRDYVPGDPLKRINWKQSAKRGRLLVRLDDEMASLSIGVVLDSVFREDKVKIEEMKKLSQYRECTEDEILPKIAEDAIENALGIMRVLLMHDYKVNFYVCMSNTFAGYELQSETDLESVRLELASYCFAGDVATERFPGEDLLHKGTGAFLYATPNSQEEAAIALGEATEQLYVTIHSVPDEAKKQSASEDALSWKDFKITAKEQLSTGEKILVAVRNLAFPYLLALLLCSSVFAVFEVPFLSVWTILQALLCAVAFGLGEYTKKHKIIGGMLVTISVMGLLMSSGRVVFGGGNLLDYMHWFLSGGESVETKASYLLSLLLVFAPFFALVVYYFTQILYRTSFLMLVSLIPAVLYVKVMQDIEMVPIVLITVLNITAFLLHVRTERDKGKRIIGSVTGWISLGFYLLIPVLAGFAAPEQEDAKYYYLFESVFMGGNVSEEVPEGYSGLSEFSGNADGFNELNNRKLYEIQVDVSGADVSNPLYLKRQNFDLYDFERDHWYAIESFVQPEIEQQEWFEQEKYLNIKHLADALQCAQEYEPGFLERYGVNHVATGYTESVAEISIRATNYESQAYIVPGNVLELVCMTDYNLDSLQTYATKHGSFRVKTGFLHNNFGYEIIYYEEKLNSDRWISLGGSDMDSAMSLAMLREMAEIFEMHHEEEHLKTVRLKEVELLGALEYGRMCTENTEQIPESVRELAQEITKDCIYDWEKAQALQQYFYQNDFVYDLSYNAPDDSVEYFLFESKTGTCSDYASAYVLMARSLGLIVRYAEGFVPQMEYAGQYVVRTDCGHAYPEVYIQNVGFMEFEATNPARFRANSRRSSGFLSYFMTMGVRVVIILAFLSAIIVSILFVCIILAPGCKELYFKYKLGKASLQQGITMIYRRIRDKRFANEILRAEANTPYEYAVAFEEKVGYDISELVLMLEKGVYDRTGYDASEKARVMVIYEEAKEAIKVYKKAQKRRKKQP